MHNPPIIDKAYLSKVLCLPTTQLISDIELCEIIESNTALTIKFKIRIKEDAGCETTRRFFIKTIKNDPKTHAYDALSLKEAEFYKFMQNVSNTNLPTAQCFDAFISQDSTKYLLLLEDLSEEFSPPDKVDLSSENIWLSAAISLGIFHAAFWNFDKIGSTDLPIDNLEKRNFNIKNIYESYEKFINYVGNRFDAETLSIYEHVIRLSVLLETERYERLFNRDNITLCHGDSHIYNFMFPYNKNETPVIIDFQFWGIGIGAGDVAHLTRESFPIIRRENLHRLIMEKYYETLLSHGVQSYSWDTCWNDYRRQVASMLLIPMWQYTFFGLQYDDWVSDVSGLISNYILLHCEELYS